MTVLYRIDTSGPGEPHSWYTRGVISERDEAVRVAEAFTATENVKTTITALDLNDPIQRDDLCSYINWLIEHQRGTRRKGPPNGTPTPQHRAHHPGG